MGKIDTDFTPAGSTSASQYLLEPERQLLLTGGAEPLTGAAANWHEVPGAGVAPERDTRQAHLFGAFQLPLPLQTVHQLVNGKVAPECNEGRGFHASTCPEHPQKPKVHPHVCGVQRCESSREVNTKERARDAWNGTADKGQRIGLRHFSVPWGIFIWTLPEQLRGACVGDRLKRFRRAAQELTEEVLQRHGAGRSEFYGRSWLHPVGDAELPQPADAGDGHEVPGAAEDGATYKPHENVLVPLVHFRAGRAHRLRPLLPKSWFGADGWVQERWREKLVEIFGQWWPSSSPAPTVNWFYECRDTVELKKHALRYFARVFPSWAGHADVRCRPRAFGLAHWKKKNVLSELVGQLEAESEFSACPHSTREAPCPAPLTVSANTEQRTVEALELAVQHYCEDRHQYVHPRRIITPERRLRGELHPLEPPPDPLRRLPVHFQAHFHENAKTLGVTA